MAEKTFLGLQPYTEEDAYRFKGRTAESQELFRLIVRNDFTVCYAESGEGKTSLLNAGVFPLLRENMYFPIAITFTSDDYKETPDNFDTIIDRCIKDSIAEYNDTNKGINVEYKLCSTDFPKLDNRAELQRELSQYSWWKLRNYKPQAMGLTFTPVFVFDQFEEVFNMPGSIVWTKKFFNWLEDVSSDSCPKEIVEKVRGIIGNKAAFPTIKEGKDFKAIFSLRKEFIGELDYWGMQTHFIPSLKNNRYCLKALTYKGAQKVMTQQERFNEDKVQQVLTYFVGQYSREPERTIEEGLPVIPALLLSVVCDSWEKDIDAFTELSTAEIGQSLNSVLERFYNQAIDTIVQELSGQYTNANLVQCRYDLDTAIFALVDSNGKRVRTKTTNDNLTQIDFDTKYKKTLSRHRIIKVTKIDGEDYVEIVHDSLCSIVAHRRNARLAEETKKREERNKKEIEETKRREAQREDMTSSLFLLALLAYLIWFISTAFCDKETALSLRVFESNVILTLGNFAVLPLIIYGAIKRLKITSWLSIYAFFSNVVLMSLFLIGENEVMTLRILYTIVTTGISVVVLIYSFLFNLFGLPRSGEFIKLLKSIPILSFYAIISAYIFYLCVFNKALGLPEPFNSSWGVVIIPLLLHEIIRNALEQKQNKIVFILLCCLFSLLTYNTSVVPFALPSYIVIVILIIVLALLLWSYKNLTLWKNTLAITIEFFVLTCVVIMNMGFNVTKIHYDKVSHVFNWVDVMVHNDDNKVGIVSACQGDTILPCKFDSIDYIHHYALLSTDKLHYPKDITDFKGLYSYKQANNSALWQCLLIDEVENIILKYKKSKPGNSHSDSLKVYAARVYHEVRNANIGYLTSGERYTLNDITSIDTLVRLQNNELADILKQMSQSATTTYSKPIDIEQVTEFNKAFARSFYLCMLKDRIIQRDSVNIFNSTQEIITLYFSDAGNFEFTTNFNNNYNVDGAHITVSSKFRASDLRNNTLDSWYNYINMLLATDMGANAEDYVNTKNDRYADILNNIQSIHHRMKQVNKSNLERMSKLLRKGDKLGMDVLKDALYIYKKQLDFTNEIKEQTNTQLNKIDIEKKQMDLDFQKLINDVFSTLANVVLNSQNIYNSEFIDICEQLYLISVLRQYEIAPIYLQYLDQIENSKNMFYLEFKKMQEQEDSLKRMVNNFRLKLNK